MITKQINIDTANKIYLDNGQPISDEEMTEYLNEQQTIATEELALLAFLVKSGQISTVEYEDRLREEIKKSYIRDMMIGAGGRDNLTQEDYNAMMVFLVGGTLLGTSVTGQYTRLTERLQSIGRYSEGQLRSISQLYINSSRQIFSFIKGRRFGVPILLPAYPGDGSTECWTNCHCHWQHLFNEFGQWIGSNWLLGVADHCATCVRRSSLWSPYVPR